MGSCYTDTCEKSHLYSQQKDTLSKALYINIAMFVAIVVAAFYSQSIALLSDSLDNFGDAFTYGLSLWVLSCGVTRKAHVALFKGVLIFIAAVVIMFQVGYRLFNPVVPTPEIMLVFSVVGLIGNSFCVYLLSRHKNDDINMSSVFECSFNDVITNFSIIIAALLIWVSNTHWPDIIIGTLLSMFLLKSSFKIISTSWQEINFVYKTSS